MNPIEIIFPSRCIGCDEVLSFKYKKHGICESCKSHIKPVSDTVCIHCGKELKDETKAYCNDCEGENFLFLQGKAVFKYTDVMKQSMYKFKYSNRRKYAKIYAGYALHRYGKWIESLGIEVIIPVPMYRKKMRRRGYNQAVEFAKEISKVTGIPIDMKSLVRVKNTIPLKSLNPTQRRKNLKNAFIFQKNGVQYENALLIDDIYTTGATINAASAVMKQSGIKNIYGMYVCIGADAH